MKTALVWHHLDLRLADNPALYYACEEADCVIPVFIWAPEEEGKWMPGAARRWWLHYSLQSFQQTLEAAGLPLVIRMGSSASSLQAIIEETGAQAVYWNQRHIPLLAKRDAGIQASFEAAGINTQVYEGTILHQPEVIRTRAGKPYQVFTPFWRKLCETLEVSTPLPVPSPPSKHVSVSSLSLEALNLLPSIDWAAGIRATWTPGEPGASQRLEQFQETVAAYAIDRDIPSLEGTSRLSPHLCHGEISVRQIWHALAGQLTGPLVEQVYLKELAWREFAYHILYHFPHTVDAPLKPPYAAFPWRRDAAFLKQWQRGETGYPIVDAGMKQLWHTGWMHNRVRMIVASFLTKDGLISWQEGAQWFWDTLVDADLANNTMGWQWAAGCGADAQPFFRIFNPTSQGKRFDPAGEYVRAWLPALHPLPNAGIHEPWLEGGLFTATETLYPPPHRRSCGCP